MNTPRWYMVNKDGMATLCVNKADAEKEAVDAQRLWPDMGPHRAVQLVEAADVEALRAGYAAARQTPQSEDLSGCGAQLLEENGRKVLSYWPYCSGCRKPFEFEKDEPFASCGCPGSTEWGDPRPASWVRAGCELPPKEQK